MKRSVYINMVPTDWGKARKLNGIRSVRFVYLPPWTLQYLQSPLMTTLPGSGDRGTAKERVRERERRARFGVNICINCNLFWASNTYHWPEPRGRARKRWQRRRISYCCWLLIVPQTIELNWCCCSSSLDLIWSSQLPTTGKFTKCQRKANWDYQQIECIHSDALCVRHLISRTGEIPRYGLGLMFLLYPLGNRYVK